MVARGLRECVGFFGLEWREFRDAAKQGIDFGAHFGFVGPLAMQRFLEHVDGS